MIDILNGRIEEQIQEIWGLNESLRQRVDQVVGPMSDKPPSTVPCVSIPVQPCLAELIDRLRNAVVEYRVQMNRFDANPAEQHGRPR